MGVCTVIFTSVLRTEGHDTKAFDSVRHNGLLWNNSTYCIQDVAGPDE